VRDDPFYMKYWVNRPPLELADFEPIIARSASAVTPSEKKYINNGLVHTRFPMSLRWSS